ncbi:histidine kinase hhk13p [Venturia nashicola]|uniref:Histidine kinase hhk13p n=1 Tax=Venturia nashicola TaxID=86259 RepID=A0A4Z1PKX6_9PEZI|nr:histidine kinase hhk13p [Venturia nashicola]
MSSPKSIFTAPEDYKPKDTQSLANPLSRRLSTTGCCAITFADQSDTDHRPPTTSHYEPEAWTRPSKIDLKCHRGLTIPTSNSSTIFTRYQVPPVAGQKRSLERSDSDIPAESVHKKSRLRHLYQHTLDSFDFPLQLPTAPETAQGPPSPLFFSNSSSIRPPLPPRFSSGEAGARMLRQAEKEESKVKTVTLARASYNGSSPPGTIGITSHRNSLERESHSGASPEGDERHYAVRLLSQVGVAELLENDSRPTFIVDLGNFINYSPGPLRILFANSALRSHPALYEVIVGRVADASPRPEPLKGHPHFKAWLLSATFNGESLEVCLPAFVHGGVSWSCSTIRRRLRVVSASVAVAGPLSASTQGAPTSSSFPKPRAGYVGGSASSSFKSNEELQDYFGAAVHTPAENSEEKEVAQSTEPSDKGRRLPDPHTPENTVFPMIDQIDHGSLEQYDSFSNECALGPSVAGSVGSFPSGSHDVGFFDWTRLPITKDLPDHIKFARSVDWAATSLGPIELWPSDLRQMCNLIMASPHPAAMYWGDDLVAIYNEAYILLAGQKHPKLMGQSYAEAWVEIWDDVKDVFANARSTGQATMKDDDCLFMKRSNYLEETYFSWSIIPMVGSDGAVTGLYNPAFEKTRRKIVERRMLTLREVGERTATARDVKGFWKQVAEALDYNPFDTPFVLLYSVNDESDSDSSSMHSSSLIGTKSCHLEGSLGVPDGHPAAPNSMELKTSMDGFCPVFRDVMKTEKPVLLPVAGSGDEEVVQNYDFDSSGFSHKIVATEKGPELAPSMLDGIEFRGFGDAVRSVVVCPIHPTTGESTLGFLVLGINPRRPYDDDYSLFIQLLSRQLATSLASVVLFEEEIRRGQRAARLAAMDRIELSQQLAARTQEARDSEIRFSRMAEFSPAALFIANSQGQITYCNETWYDITRVPKDSKSTDRWIDAVSEDDQPVVRKRWSELVEECKPVEAFEFRFKAKWRDRHGNSSDTWALFSAYPETHSEDSPGAVVGSLKSVFGSLTNISQQKWAEDFQKRKMEEAIERKRQQENFIDITSHEMRNPLSAILQCADEIATGLADYQVGDSNAIDAELVKNSVEAAQTITLCAQHQKQIVDDILTLSKLDSHMLMVTPIDVQPISVVQRALKMHENEVRNADIDMKFIVDPSFTKLNIDWVKIDPQRVLQVLINLTSNAIKFTSGSDRRTIYVKISASARGSLIKDPEVNYFPTRKKDSESLNGPDWGEGEEVFIQFAVQDTGRGLSVEEKKMLFMRFSQASPRTHIQYGGSGLGLFISRELTELQGGEIGVASEAGKGSTFAFFVKARRSSKPADPEQQFPALVKTLPQESKGAVKRGGSIRTRDFAQMSAQHSGQSKERKDIHILIVEDNLVNQRVLEKQLKNLGFTCFVANHGGECLDRLKESRFWHGNASLASPAGERKDNSRNQDLSVVLMDQEMPIMDGLKTTKTIREWEKQGLLIAHVPIIGVTANARAEQIETLMRAGMDDVVSKPFRIPEIVPKIEEMSAKYPPSLSSPQPSSAPSPSLARVGSKSSLPRPSQK